MRLCMIAALTIACQCFSKSSEAQKVNLNITDEPLEKVFGKIRGQTHAEFCYRQQDIRFRVSCNLCNATAEEAVAGCLFGLPLLAHRTVSKDGIVMFMISRMDSVQTRGKIVNEEKQPQEGLTVTVRNTKNCTVTDRNGEFCLRDVADTATLIIEGVNILPGLCRPEGRIWMDITVGCKRQQLPAASVSGSNGIGKISQQYSTGAISITDSEKIGQIPSAGFLERLTGQVSGLLTGPGDGNTPNLSIRGRNTIFAMTQPLIVLDNFVFYGSFSDINPNDINTITVLKDAVAASIWGARSANGVIVITTKKGARRGPRLIAVNINTTVSERPNLFYIPLMRPADYISVEKYLFSKGMYDATLDDPSYPAVTPVVEILNEMRSNKMSPAQGNALINGLAAQDARTGLQQYFYQQRIAEQVHCSITGGNAQQPFYFSFGYDHDRSTLQRNPYKRYTVHDAHAFKLLHNRLEIALTGNFVYSRLYENNPGTLPVAYPYARLADPGGVPLPVNDLHRAGYSDTAGGGRLLDWAVRPLQDLRLADNSSTQINFYLQGAIKYNMTPALSMDLLYRLMYGHTGIKDLYSKDGSYARNLVNSFTAINGSDILYPVPVGDILFSSATHYVNEDARAQLTYTGLRPKKYRYTFSAGLECTDMTSGGRASRLYGYDPNGNTQVPVDLVNPYPDYTTGNRLQIPSAQDIPNLYTRYLSVYNSLDLVFKDQYLLYAAARKDATNIVGVEANRKWSPFWAVGVGWLISNAGFYQCKRLPMLKLRIGWGSNGNIGSRNAYLVTQMLGTNAGGDPQRGIVNPPNPLLGWERTRMLNLGLDFSIAQDSCSPGGRIYGSLDLFRKTGTNLLGSDTLPPSTGLPAYFGNTAAMRGRGLDLLLATDNIRGNFTWSSTYMLSIADDRITRYLSTPPSVSGYVIGNNPVVGRPVTALMSYRWAGLDHEKGDPQGYLNGQVSKAYKDIVNASVNGAEGAGGGEGIEYSGTYQPIVYGSLMNTFRWKKCTLSFLIIYKLDYDIRRTSINYYRLFSGQDAGHKDYSRRWQIPGDEKTTDIPSMPETNDPDRSLFYQYSQSLITKADHIRLQNVNLHYDIIKAGKKCSGFRNLQAFLFINNPGILWRANKYGIDPDAAGYGDLPEVRSYTLGIQANL